MERDRGGRPFMGDLFDPEPETWGLRGDPFAWAEMRETLDDTPIPDSFEAAATLLRSAFATAVGVDISDPQEQIAIDRFDHGGMSGGWVHLATWQERLMPLLEHRARAAIEGP